MSDTHDGKVRHVTFLENQAAAWTEIRERFSCNETANGPGSTLARTVVVRHELPRILRDYDITSMLDAPCGDWNWMQHVDLSGVDYTGWDVEPATIAANSERWSDTKFAVENLLTVKRIPSYDLILCRDFLMHLPNKYIQATLRRFIKSGSKYLLVSNFPGAANSHRICPLDGGHDDRPGYYCCGADLEAEPFNLKGRIESVMEDGDVQELVLYDLWEN